MKPRCPKAGGAKTTQTSRQYDDTMSEIRTKSARVVWRGRDRSARLLRLLRRQVLWSMDRVSCIVVIPLCRRDSLGFEPLSAMLHCRSATESCEARSAARETAICSAGGRMVPDTAEIRTSACMSAVAIPAVSSHCRRCCTAVLPQSRVKRGRRRGKRPSALPVGGWYRTPQRFARLLACLPSRFPRSRAIVGDAARAVLPQSRVKRGRRRGKRPSGLPVGGMVPDTAEIRIRRDSRGLEPLSAMLAVLPQSRVKRGRRRGKRPSALPVGGRYRTPQRFARLLACLPSRFPRSRAIVGVCCTAVLPQSRVKRGRRREKRPSGLPVADGAGHRRDSHVCLHVCRRDSRGLEPLSAMLHVPFCHRVAVWSSHCRSRAGGV